MDHNLYHEIEDKAQILVDSLPYIRDYYYQFRMQQYPDR